MVKMDTMNVWMAVLRTKREAEGPVHYTELTVDKAIKLNTIDIPDEVSATEIRIRAEINRYRIRPNVQKAAPVPNLKVRKECAPR